MRSRSIKSLIAVVAVSFLALPAGAQARHGSDDPAGHVRHGVHHVRHAGEDSRQHSRRTRSRVHHRRHGADDRAAHRRHRADDGPNHR